MHKARIIERLAADLEPTHRLPAGSAVALWLALSWTFVVVVTLATGDLRPGVVAQLTHSPRFVTECLLGFGVGFFAIRSGVLLALPGRTRWKRAVPAALGMVALWVGLYVYGLVDPALEPSMEGKRPHCFLETLVFSSFPLVLGLWLVARRTPIRRGWTGVLVGVSAASLPALMMQIACMYDPEHILLLHLLPVVVMGMLGGVLGRTFVQKP